MSANEIFTLEKGIRVGDVEHKECRLKNGNSAEALLSAALKSQQVAMVPAGVDARGETLFDPQLLCNPHLMAYEILRLRIDKLGDLDMPLEEELFGMLSEKDLEILQQEADILDGLAINKELADRGKSDSASAGAE